MANYSTLKAAIQQVIKTNGNNEITGAILQSSLLSMINSLGAGYQFMGVATPATDPGTPDARIFFIAKEKGTYTNFNNTVIEKSGLYLLYFDTEWRIINIFDMLIELTYSQMVILRQNGGLIPGCQYRITDYNTTVTGDTYTVGGHQFDVIVVADSVNSLNENARAIQHSGDTYFANSKLARWEIKYCIDNDTNRFDWADTANGKGVIYYMKDEFENECPYDFKNIMFYRGWSATNQLWSVIVSRSTSGAKLCYTFSSSGTSATTAFYDLSIDAENDVYGNKIVDYIGNGKLKLHNICFFGNNCYGNTFGNNCLYTTFGNNCYGNTFGNHSHDNIFGNSCYSNILGNSFYNNIFGKNCRFNIFGNNCHSNILGNSCHSNTFGNGCYANIFASDSAGSKGDYFRYIIVDNEVTYSTLYNTATASSSNYVQNYHIKSSIVGTSSNKIIINAVRNLSYDTTVAKNSSGVVKTYCEADLIQ